MGTSREQGNCRTSDNDDSNAHLAFPSYNQFGSALYGLRRTIPYGGTWTRPYGCAASLHPLQLLCHEDS